MTTVPNPDEARKLAGRLGAIAEIEAIVLRSVQWKVYDLVFDLAQDIAVLPEYNMSQGRRGGLIRYPITSKLTGRVSEGELFRLEAIHEMFFTIPEDTSITDEQIAAFGAITAFFMAFPYIRELLHQLTGNAGLPTVLLRPHRLLVDPVDAVPSVDPELSPASGDVAGFTSSETS